MVDFYTASVGMTGEMRKCLVNTISEIVGGLRHGGGTASNEINYNINLIDRVLACKHVNFLVSAV